MKRGIYKNIAVGFFGTGVFILGLLVGIVRTDFFLAELNQKSLAPYVGDKVSVEGKVVADTDRRDSSMRVTIEVEEINDEPLEKNKQGRLIAILQRDSDIEFGDHLRLSGKLVLPEKFETNTGRLFDYPSYLKVRGISAVMNYATIEDVSRGGFSLMSTLYSVKHAFERALEKIFVEPQGALSEGILLGEKRGLPEDLSQAFIIAGLVHVVVLSGYNISIVAEWVMRAFSFLPKTLGLVSGGVVIVFFALMTGGSATAVRACIMALIAVLGRYVNRPSDALRALIAATTLMALFNPLFLLHDPSFILSVLATFGLITISPSVEQKLSFITKKFGLREIAASTISVQIYVLPALLYMTGVLSFVSVPANLLALPVVPLAMLMSFLGGVLGLVHPLLAFVPAFIADLLLRWMIFIAYASAALPLSSTVVSAFPLWVAVLAYIPLTAFALHLFRSSAKLGLVL